MVFAGSNLLKDRKNLILDAGKKRFKRFGVKKTTMDEICGDVGLSKKTVYEIFRSKDELFVSLFIRETLKVRRLFLKEVGHIDDPLERILQLFRVAVNYFRHESFWVQVLKDEDGLYAPFLREKYRRQVEEGILDILAGILEQGIAKGEIRPLNTRTMSYFLFKLFQSISYARTASIKGDEEDLETMMGFISAGIAVKRVGGPEGKNHELSLPT
jgi:AcrR family transcriptional regulator